MPSKSAAFDILDAAYAGGIDVFDTAPTYGSAEEILGEWITTRALKNKARVISKLKANTHDVQFEIEKTLQRLTVDRLDGYLLHSAKDLDDERTVEGLRVVKKAGLTEHIGVSIYTDAEAEKAFAKGMEYVQVPYNVFDRRFENTHEKGAVIFARSPFLQGLLLMEPSTIPEPLAAARPLVSRFREIAQAHGLSPAAAALFFSHEKSGAAYTVLGAETAAQLKENVSLQAPADAERFLQEIEDAFPEVPESIVNPSLWDTAT
jgi:aryl-alcohol dehydrogenase-like predicted oxidoreductase